MTEMPSLYGLSEYLIVGEYSGSDILMKCRFDQEISAHQDNNAILQISSFRRSWSSDVLSEMFSGLFVLIFKVIVQ
jgi:hypothetical protein